MTKLPSEIEVTPCGPLKGVIQPPGSKSITNRALICAALADGPSVLEGALDSEDTQVMIQSLGRLGLVVELDNDQSIIHLQGCGGEFPRQRADLFVGNSGTTIRFLTAALTVSGGELSRSEFHLDGVERMRQRPIGDLVVGLRQLGANVQAENDQYPPVRVRASGLSGGIARVKGDISSQFLSGILMAAPYARGDVELIVDGPLVSQPYIEMTLRIMEAFRAQVRTENLERFYIAAPQVYKARRYAIEPDASAASYFWAAAAIAGGRATVQGLSKDALQGDVAFCEALSQMGCGVEYGPQNITVEGGKLHGVEIDMNAISDTVQTLAAVALFAEGSTTITGVAHIRHKETDRIGDLARELRKLGGKVEEFPDGLRIEGGALSGARIETYNDHRMAMSLALVGLRVGGVVIQDPACTQKTYPRFFEDLKRFCELT